MPGRAVGVFARPRADGALRCAAACAALAAAGLLGCGELLSYAESRFAPRALDPSQAGPDYAVQGEYAAPGAPLAAQVIALGDDRFEAVFFRGGLPGAGWNGEPPVRAGGRRRGGATRFDEPHPAEIAGGVLRVAAPSPLALPRVERASPTLGAPPPPGAVVLFDGAGLGEIEGRVDERGLLAEGATTRRRFGSFRLHVEFRLPFEPTLSAQWRGNSGVYLQGRYEIQVLDSFGLPAEERGAGSIYGQRAPDLNMSFPPLAWQTYDIDFTAARFDAARKVAPARVSVRHNGVRIHDDVPLTGQTGQGSPEGPEPGPIVFQDHYHPVRFRNLWVVPRS